MGARGFTYPCTLGMGMAARGQTLGVARPIAFQYAIEFAPVDRSELMTLIRLVPPKLRIGNAKVQELSLRHREVDELLPQLVVREALDLPALRFAAVRRIGIRGPEHHERRP